jgi:hypothetical protein
MLIFYYQKERISVQAAMDFFCDKAKNIYGVTKNDAIRVFTLATVDHDQVHAKSLEEFGLEWLEIT